jgi:hypothetical protein
VDNTVQTNVLRFRGYVFSVIFNDRHMCRMKRPMISFGARKVDKKIQSFLEFPRSNNVGTLPVIT